MVLNANILARAGSTLSFFLVALLQVQKEKNVDDDLDLAGVGGGVVSERAGHGHCGELLRQIYFYLVF